MKYYLDNMMKNMSREDKALLMAIYEPQVVAVPPSDACRNMCVTPEGEIRIYGAINKRNPEDIGTPVYISSSDCGLSWKTHLNKNRKIIGAAGYNPKTGRYISGYPSEFRPDLTKSYEKEGTWAILNDEGFNSDNNRFVKISDKLIHILRKPFLLESIDRWIMLGEYTRPDHYKQIAVSYSDDDGESWVTGFIEESAPEFVPSPPHKGVRWQQYSCEPTVAELSDGSLMMIVRTSQDYHYMYRSYDKGETWSGPERTDFHSTITMPVLYRLSDGRTVFFWCNTQPMPELDHEKIWPELDEDEKNGVWEDVFTNRDANHMAISEDDGKTWIGFREIFLNAVRNNVDFRSTGGVNSRDKSVHQAEILELPFNKLLIQFGQNTASRKVVILDIAWLYEKERREDFRLGLNNLSTQMYVKSNLGMYRHFSGHCAYNRTNGALLVQDPDGNFEEAMQLCRIEDERLAYKKQGAVWNFPASHKGEVSVKLRVLKSGVALSLTDHWYNPCDETVRSEAHVSFNVENINRDSWEPVTIKYDTDKMCADIYIDDEYIKTVKMNRPAPNGLCYLHIQTLAETEDQEGTLIKYIEKR